MINDDVFENAQEVDFFADPTPEEKREIDEAYEEQKKISEAVKAFQKFLMEEYDLRPSTALAIVYNAMWVADIVKADIAKAEISHGSDD